MPVLIYGILYKSIPDYASGLSASDKITVVNRDTDFLHQRSIFCKIWEFGLTLRKSKFSILLSISILFIKFIPAALNSSCTQIIVPRIRIRKNSILSF
jgi:hypothetical protein